MIEHAFHIKLKPGLLEKYKALHSPVPNDVIAQLKRAGVTNFSIFADGDDIFGLMHYPDHKIFSKVMEELVAPEWVNDVVEISEKREVDPSSNSLKALERVFRLD